MRKASSELIKERSEVKKESSEMKKASSELKKSRKQTEKINIITRIEIIKLKNVRSLKSTF